MSASTAPGQDGAGVGVEEYWARLGTGFADVRAVFDDLIAEAIDALTPAGLLAYLDAAKSLGKLGRGPAPMLALLEVWPEVAGLVGEAALPDVLAVANRMQRSPNGAAIAPLLESLGPVARRLPTRAQLGHYLDICSDLMSATTISIHGRHTTIESPSLTTFLATAPRLLDQVTVAGLRVWADYGIRHHLSHPDQQRAYFALDTPDSNAVLTRQRQGVLFLDVERSLDLYLRGLWQDADHLIPYSTAFHEIRKPVPYYDRLGIRIPDAYRSAGEVPGMERYYAALAHMAGHRRWSRSMVADNWSPFQRMAVEFFEDSRIDTLVCAEYPGVRPMLLALHPTPDENAPDPETMSTLRHRLTMISRAVLDPDHGYSDPLVSQYAQGIRELAESGGDTAQVAEIALEYVTRSRRQSDQFAKIWFDDTVVEYRDDNRNLWRFIEEGDEEETFSSERPAEPKPELDRLPPRHYPEWDYSTLTYRPDWVSVYEALHPPGDPGAIDALLAKHSALAARLKRLLDLLKPQDKVRVRYQEDGSELDLDVALRAFIDYRSGVTPEPRITMSHETAGRDLAVLLLVDLSESLNAQAPGADETVLELAREAVALLAWAIDALGDSFAIAGFHSSTRHDVRYWHIKGFSEPWDDRSKSRLAAVQAGLSTRLGAAMRHASHYLSARRADKKLMLVLTDGRPHDIDVTDERLLVEDARRAVTELDRDGIFTYCINLDPAADDYVSDIFGRRYTVIDNISRLPEKLPELFLALTR